MSMGTATGPSAAAPLPQPAAAALQQAARPQASQSSPAADILSSLATSLPPSDPFAGQPSPPL